MTTGADDAPPGLGEAMSRIARQLQEEHGDVERTLQAIAAAAVETVPSADACSISYVIGRREVEPRASTGELPRRIDELQSSLGQGPCLDAVWEQQVVRVDDLGAEQRWPDFAREASALGVGSMMCLQLFVSQDRLGAMNLFAGAPAAFDGESEQVGLMLAGHAAVALAGARQELNLRRAVASRDLIGQAKGILMERYRLTADQAFGVLVRVSQETQRKLIDVAGELNESGLVPGSPQREN